MESDAGEIPQAAAEAKNDKRYEGRIGVGIGRFTLETHQEGFMKRIRKCGTGARWTSSTHVVAQC